MPEKTGAAGPGVTETARGEAAAGETGWWGKRAGSEGCGSRGERWAIGGRMTTMSGELRIRESAKRDGLFVAWRAGTAAVGEVP